jgi:hypothetical protein
MLHAIVRRAPQLFVVAFAALALPSPVRAQEDPVTCDGCVSDSYTPRVPRPVFINQLSSFVLAELLVVYTPKSGKCFENRREEERPCEALKPCTPNIKISVRVTAFELLQGEVFANGTVCGKSHTSQPYPAVADGTTTIVVFDGEVEIKCGTFCRVETNYVVRATNLALPLLVESDTLIFKASFQCGPCVWSDYHAPPF